MISLSGRTPFGVLALCVAVGSCSDPAAPPARRTDLVTGPTTPGVHVISGESASDSAFALPPQPLIVRVRGPDGQPLAGVVVQARALPHDTLPGRLSMAVAAAFTEAGFAAQASTTTDANGYAQFTVRLGTVAGAGAVEVRATSAEASSLPRDTARFTIGPGRPAQFLLAPRDTVLYVGGVAQLRARTTDQHGNLVADAPSPSFEAASAHVTVTAEGAVTGAQFGRTWVRVRAGEAADSVGVTVVPTGTIAARNFGFPGPLLGRGRIVAINLDGTQIRDFVPANLSISAGDYIPDWDPTAERIIIDAGPGGGQRLYTYTVGGAPQQVMTAPNGLTEEFRPQYSADGWIYFAGRAGGIAIYRVRRDGSGLVRVSSATPIGEHTHPSPSPDGTRVVVMSTSTNGCTGCAGVSFALRIVDVATGAETATNVGGLWPRWSPAGDLIAFINGSGALAVMRPDGSGLRVVSVAGQQYTDPIDWSPDGRWLIARPSNGAGLHLVEVETTLTLPLTYAAGLTYPSWRP